MTTAQPEKDPRDEAVDAAIADPKVAEAPQEDKQETLNEERDNRCKPVAMAILKMLAGKEDLMIGMVDQDEVVDYYSDLYVELIPILQEHNVKVDDLKYIFSIAQQGIQLLNSRTDMTMELLKNQASAFKWGVSDIAEVTINDIDNTLKEMATASQKAAEEQQSTDEDTETSDKD